MFGEYEEDGNNAVVHYTESGSDMTLDLVKEDGNCKVKFDKMGGMMDDMDDASDGLDSLSNVMDDMTDSLGTVVDDAIDAIDSATEIIDDAN